jgi:hypothetical protein
MQAIILGYWGSFADFVKQHHDEINAISAVVIAFFTVVLARVARKQTRITRVLQRAYLDVKFGGIGQNTAGEILGHVTFVNVGHLPAQKFSRVVNLSTGGPNWEPPKIQKKELVGKSIIPVGAEWPEGSIGSTHPQDAKSLFVYVWGRATYKDGFRWRKRYVNFCHRYPWEMRETPSGGGISISTKYARYHGYGNSAS